MHEPPPLTFREFRLFEHEVSLWMVDHQSVDSALEAVSRGVRQGKLDALVPLERVPSWASKAIDLNREADRRELEFRVRVLPLVFAIHQQVGRLCRGRRELRSSALRGSVAWSLAEAYVHVFRLEDAVRCYADASREYRSARLQDESAHCQMMQAVMLKDLGGYEEALPLFRGAARQFRQLGDDLWYARCLVNLGACLREERKTEQGLKMLDEARTLLAGHDHQALGLCQMNRAIALRDLGRDGEAIPLYEEAARLLANDPVNHALCLMNQAISEQYLGRSSQALKLYRQAEDLMRTRLSMPTQLARCLLSHANCLSSLGEGHEAVDLYLEARTLFEKYGNAFEVARCAMNLGLCMESQGHYEEAVELLDEAEDRFRQLGRMDRVAMCHAGRGVLYARREQYDIAIDLWRETLTICERAGSQLDDVVWRTKYHIARALAQTRRDLDEAASWLAERAFEMFMRRVK